MTIGKHWELIDPIARMGAVAFPVTDLGQDLRLCSTSSFLWRLGKPGFGVIDGEKKTAAVATPGTQNLGLLLRA